MLQILVLATHEYHYDILDFMSLRGQMWERFNNFSMEFMSGACFIHKTCSILCSIQNPPCSPVRPTACVFSRHISGHRVICFLVRWLFQVVDAERDIETVQSGGDLVYHTIIGLQPQDTVEDDSESSSSSELGSNFINSSRPRNESPESKKVSFGWSQHLVMEIQVLPFQNVCISNSKYWAK